MESISLRGPAQGLDATVKGYATGAVEKTSEKTGKPYYQLHLSPDEDAAKSVYVFCEREHAEAVSDAIRTAGAAVPFSATLTLGRRGVNVATLKL